MGTLSDTHRGTLTRLPWLLLGLVCVGLGGVGVVVPGLPTTVFFIAAAACFTRSSRRLEAWVLGLPRIGPAVRDYRAGLGMPRRAKTLALVMLVASVAVSCWFLSSWIVRGIVIGVGTIGVVVILRVPTRDEPPRPT